MSNSAKSSKEFSVILDQDLLLEYKKIITDLESKQEISALQNTIQLLQIKTDFQDEIIKQLKENISDLRIINKKKKIN